LSDIQSAVYFFLSFFRLCAAGSTPVLEHAISHSIKYSDGKRGIVLQPTKRVTDSHWLYWCTRQSEPTQLAFRRTISYHFSSLFYSLTSRAVSVWFMQSCAYFIATELPWSVRCVTVLCACCCLTLTSLFATLAQYTSQGAGSKCVRLLGLVIKILHFGSIITKNINLRRFSD